MSFLSEYSLFNALKTSRMVARDLKALEGTDTPEANRQRKELSKIIQSSRRVFMIWMLAIPAAVGAVGALAARKIWPPEAAPVSASAPATRHQKSEDPYISYSKGARSSQEDPHQVYPKGFSQQDVEANKLSMEERMKKIDPQGVLSKKDIDKLKVLEDAVKKSDEATVRDLQEITRQNDLRRPYVDAYKKGFDVKTEYEAKKKFFEWIDQDFPRVIQSTQNPISEGDIFPLRIPFRQPDGQPLFVFPDGGNLMAKMLVLKYEEKKLSSKSVYPENEVANADGSIDIEFGLPLTVIEVERSITLSISEGSGKTGWQPETREYKATVRYSLNPDGTYKYYPTTNTQR